MGSMFPLTTYNSIEEYQRAMQDVVMECDMSAVPPGSSQLSLPSTEIPQSPVDVALHDELNDDGGHDTLPAVIPSSVSPPPSGSAAAAAAAVVAAVVPTNNPPISAPVAATVPPPSSQAATTSTNTTITHHTSLAPQPNARSTAAAPESHPRPPPPSSQLSNLFSPPATVQAQPPSSLRRQYSTTTTAPATAPPAIATIIHTSLSLSSSSYIPPTPQVIADASADQLRAALHTCIAEQQRLKTEAAHHKLQLSLVTLQADEDAKRAAVEHDMMRAEVEALRMAELSRRAKGELNAAAESLQVRYLQLKLLYGDALGDNDEAKRRLRLAKKVIQQKEEENGTLLDERDMLLNRIRENREHFRELCSPGGIFHSALAPRPKPQHAAPRRTSSSLQTHSQPTQVHHQHQHHHQSTVSPPPPPPRHSQFSDERDQGQERFSALLQVLSQENNSAPSSPVVTSKPPPRLPARHTRNVQSLSSLPMTPARVPSGKHSALLPSADLVPHTEPPLQRQPQHRSHRPSDHDQMDHATQATSSSSSKNPEDHRHRHRICQPTADVPPPPPHDTYPEDTFLPAIRPERGRRSRESTISAEDNEELARQAINVAAQKAAQAAAAFLALSANGGHQPDHEEHAAPNMSAAQATAHAAHVVLASGKRKLEHVEPEVVVGDRPHASPDPGEPQKPRRRELPTSPAKRVRVGSGGLG